MVNIKLSVSGGLEPLFGEADKELVIPDGLSVREVILWIKNNLLGGDADHQFVIDGTIRPGILVLLNDADCELVGMDHVLLDFDSLSFISTIHGG